MGAQQDRGTHRWKVGAALNALAMGKKGVGGTMGQKGMGMQWTGAQWAGGTMDGPHHSQDMLVVHVCTKVQPTRRQVHMNWTRWSTGSHSAS